MADAGALFNQGFANGLQARRQRDARKQQEFENDLRKRESDLELAVREKKKQQMETEWALQKEALRSDAARYVEAEKALDMFNTASSLIDFGAPNAAEQYQKITLQYLPTILKHEGASKKWEAFDKQVKQGAAFSIEKAREAGVVGAYRQAVELGIVDFPKRPNGDLDTEVLQGKIDEALERKLARDSKVRRAAVDARVDAEASGAYGGRTASKPQIGPGSKAELDLVKSEIQEIDKSLTDLTRVNVPPNDPRVLSLQARRVTRLRQLRAFDAMVEPPRAADPAMFQGSGPEAPKAPDAPGAEGASRTIKLGDFTGTIYDK